MMDADHHYWPWYPAIWPTTKVYSLEISLKEQEMLRDETWGFFKRSNQSITDRVTRNLLNFRDMRNCLTFWVWYNLPKSRSFLDRFENITSLLPIFEIDSVRRKLRDIFSVTTCMMIFFLFLIWIHSHHFILFLLLCLSQFLNGSNIINAKFSNNIFFQMIKFIVGVAFVSAF